MKPVSVTSTREQAIFFGVLIVGISICEQTAAILPPEKIPLPRWGLDGLSEDGRECHLNLDVMDGVNEDQGIFLFTSSWAARRFIESDDGAAHLHDFTPREHGLRELFDIMCFHRLVASPPVMHGCIDAKNTHPCQGLRSFLISVALRDIDIALMNGTENVSVETLYVVNY